MHLKNISFIYGISGLELDIWTVILRDIYKQYVGPYDNYSRSEVGVFECMSYLENLRWRAQISSPKLCSRSGYGPYVVRRDPYSRM